MSPISKYPVPPMTVEAAIDWAQRIHEYVGADARDEDQLDGAYARFEQRYGIGRWTIDHLRKAKAKTCDIGVFARLQAAYLDLCERQAAKLQQQIAILKATSDDDLADLDAEAARLAQKVAAKKAALRLHRSQLGGGK